VRANHSEIPDTSATVSFTTTLPDTTPPSAPFNLQATATGTQVGLSWSASTDDNVVTGYRVERCVGATCSNFAEVAAPSTTTLTDAGLLPTTTYSYRVRATDAAGNFSGYSNVSVATTGAAPTGLVAAYGFNEGSGTTLVDVSGNNRNGTITGATWVAGKYGQALNFDSNDLVNFGDLDLTNSFTVMGWLQTRNIFSGGGCASFVMKPLDYGFEICNGLLYAEVGSGTTWTASVTQPLTTADLNTWKHVALTYSGTTLRFYINGALIGQANGTHTPNNTALIFGRWTPASEFWNGLMDDVRLYSRALTQAEIQTDMNTPVAAPPTGQPPTITNPGPQSGAEGTPVSLQLTASDPENDAITFSANGLPPGLSISTSGVITGTPTFASAGTHTVTATAAAAGQSDSEIFSWTIANTNRAPTLTNPGNQSTSAGNTISLALSAIDPDGDALSYSATGLPPSLAVNPTTGVISGTVATTSTDTYTVTATAADATLSSSVTFTWTVAAPNAPPSVTLTAPAAGTVSGTVQVTAAASDDVGVVGVQFLLDGVALGAEDTSVPYGVSWNTLTAANGLHTLAARARDGNGNTTTTPNISVNVSNASVGLVAAYGFNEGSGTTLPDVSGNNRNGTITGATWVAAGKYGQALNFDGNDLVNFGDLDLNGSFTVMGWLQTRSILSGGGGCASFVMKPLDYGFEICNGLLYAEVGSGTTWTAAVTVPLTTADLNTWKHVALTYNGTTLRFYVNGALVGQANGSHTSNNTALIMGRWTPASEFWNGLMDDVRLYSRELSQAEVQIDMNTPVGAPPSGAPPILANPGPQSSFEGNTVALQLSASDPDGDPITYGATGLPSALSINPGSGLISGTLAFTSAGTATVVVTATAAGQTDTETFSWTVADINRPPAVVNPGTQNNAELASVSLLIAANDADGDVLTYSATGLPPNLTINSTTGMISGTLSAGSIGSHTVTVTASDLNLTTPIAFTWNVAPAATAPAVTVTAPAAGATVSGTVNVTASASDDVGVLGVQFFVNGAPLGNEDIAPPYDVTWNTLASPNGTYNLTARARDANGNMTTSSVISVTVNNASTGLLAQYGFNDGSGTVLRDSSGNGRNGSITGATWVAGKFGQALNFDGNDFVNLGDFDLTGSFTVMGWLQTLSRFTNGCASFVMKAFDYGFEICQSRLIAEVASGTSWTAAVSQPLTNADLNTWKHVAMTYDGTTVRFYVNGTFIGQANGAHTQNNNSLLFGRWTPSSEFWNGLMDEVRIFNRVLSPAEIQSLMNTPIGSQP
jgi:hypothetical protein